MLHCVLVLIDVQKVFLKKSLLYLPNPCMQRTADSKIQSQTAQLVFWLTMSILAIRNELPEEEVRQVFINIKKTFGQDHR